MRKIISPLRYPGGKARIAGFLEDMIAINNLEKVKLYEPYAGGAGASLVLLKNKVVDQIVLNDLDYHIYAFWFSILNYTEEFISLLERANINVNHWKKQKHIYENIDKYDILEIGFSTFFLNRTNRSGVLNAGPIGGKEQEGLYKIDVRFNKQNLIKRIELIADLKEKITLYNEESLSLLKRIFKKKEGDRLFFLDPPYYKQGKNLYYNFYDGKDHNELAEILGTYSNENWFLTYDNCSPIKELYSSFRKAYLPMTYTLQRKIKTKEIMVFSNTVNIPRNLRMGNTVNDIEIVT